MKTTVSTLTPFNFGLVIAGLIIMMVGLHRISPFKLDKAFWIQNGPLVVILAIAFYFFRLANMANGFTNWAGAAVGLSSRFVPLMVLLILVMSIGSIVMKVYDKQVERLLIESPTAVPLVGTFIMPTPSAGAPIVERLWGNKELRPMFLYFLQAASLASIPLFMMRRMGIHSSEITSKMYITGFIMAVVTFPLRVPLCRLTEFIYNKFL